LGQILFVILMGVWLLLEVYLHLFHSRRAQVADEEKRSKYVMLALLALGPLGGRILSPSFAPAFLEPFGPGRYAGLLVSLAGLALRAAVVRRMGRRFSVNPGVEAGQELITDGLFRWVRHPSYLGLLLLYTGIAISYAHPVASPLAVGLPLVALLYRIRVEERVLVERYAEAYQQYRERTRTLIPFLW
jgi:protein-S-isoprenylcysteine O-methyltransferase Ste14